MEVFKAVGILTPLETGVGAKLLDCKALQALGCWTGYRVERVEWPSENSRTLSLYLEPISKAMYCEQCGKRCQ